jgi:RNA recognition motif-containing protein
MSAVFVTNLSKSVDEDDLELRFARFGHVDAVSIWVDYEVRSYRFAIVQMRNDADAKRAIKALDQKMFCGRMLWVEEAPQAFAALPSLCEIASKNRHMYRPFGLPRSLEREHLRGHKIHNTLGGRRSARLS